MIEVGRTEEVIREMDKLANEDHTHHADAEEISVYRNNWWTRSNFVGSDTMPVRHSKKHCPPCDASRIKPKLAKLFLILVELARFFI